MGGRALSPNAIGSVVPPFGGGGGGAAALSSALPVLWEWNRTDLLQFDTGSLLDYSNSVLGGPAGVVTPSFVADTFQGNPGIRLTADAAFLGGFVLPVSAAELALPSRYILQARISRITGAGMVATVNPWGIIDPTTLSTTGWKGAVFRRDGGFSIAQHRLTTFFAGPPAVQLLRAVGVTDTPPTAGTWNATMESRGGVTLRFECFRQDGDTPADWAWRTVLDDDANYDSGGLAEPQATGGGSTTPNWDGEDMVTFGVGILNDTGGAAAGSVDFLDLRVFQHPFDVPR
ncbi:MAG TPA: hypothetical protein VIV14_00970 [Gammaproteobacteria bacterium]